MYGENIEENARDYKLKLAIKTLYKWYHLF